MLRFSGSVAIVTSILALPSVALAQFGSSLSQPSTFGASSVTTITDSALAQPVFIDPRTTLPGVGTPSQLVIDPGLPGIHPSIIGQPLLIVPASALSNTTFGSVVGTTQIFSVPTAPIPSSYEIIPNGLPVLIFESSVSPDQIVPTTPIVPRPPLSIVFTRTVIGRQLLQDPGVISLDEDLLRATCQQNWQRAIEIVDRTIAQTPENQFVYRSQLQDYRQRLQSFGNRRTITSTQAARCVGG